MIITEVRLGIAAALTFAVAACSTTNEVATRARIDQAPPGAFVQPLPTPLNTEADTASGEQDMQIYLTGYSFWDNTPRGSARIARPVIHRSAGGTGTYADPITLAVGHVKRGSRSIMDFPEGTRFYVERLRKYAIVEDLCGDGPRPQNGPCHSGHNGLAWLDIYVGGKTMNADDVNRCMYRITGVQKVVMNPAPDYLVQPGEISTTGCTVF